MFPWGTWAFPQKKFITPRGSYIFHEGTFFTPWGTCFEFALNLVFHEKVIS
jgi:predicted esterase